MVDMKKAPFYLEPQQEAWVEETLAGMSEEEKIGQLFVPIGYSTNPEYLKKEILAYHVGGLFFRDGVGEEMRQTFAFAQSASGIPLLIPSNLEAGGDGAASDGTSYGKQMSVAAAGDPVYAYRLGKIACSEGAAIGVNWAFAPVVDIDCNFRNPITNVRTYGDDPDRVIANAKEYLRAANECGVAACIKHFPGDGVDERDQHILTSVNSLSAEKWRKSYGRIYRELIAEDALTVMVGHIAFPAYENAKYPEHAGQIIPGSQSRAVVTDLLREELGFNGLVITDASPMVGYASAGERRVMLPQSIENGCDMILFNLDLAEDFAFMQEGLNNGLLSRERLDDAVRRILSVKAALRLPEKKAKGTLVPLAEGLSVLRCAQHEAWARELADRSVTLVKDTEGNLPLSAGKTKKILLEILGDFPSNERVLGKVKEELERRDFEVTVYEPEDFSSGFDNIEEFHKKYDAVLYIANIENASNQTTSRINWYTFYGGGNNVPWFAGEVPTVFVSVANPYHLLDVPMIKTFINAYSNNNYVLEAIVEKLTGESDFTGISPVDPFCGRKELAY